MDGRPVSHIRLDSRPSEPKQARSQVGTTLRHEISWRPDPTCGSLNVMPVLLMMRREAIVGVAVERPAPGRRTCRTDPVENSDFRTGGHLFVLSLGIFNDSRTVSQRKKELILLAQEPSHQHGVTI